MGGCLDIRPFINNSTTKHKKVDKDATRQHNRHDRCTSRRLGDARISAKIPAASQDGSRKASQIYFRGSFTNTAPAVRMPAFGSCVDTLFSSCNIVCSHVFLRHTIDCRLDMHVNHCKQDDHEVLPIAFRFGARLPFEFSIDIKFAKDARRAHTL